MSKRTTILVGTLAVLCCSSAMAAEKKPLKVFVLAGQSNMEGHAHIRTFDYIGDDPATAPMLKEMRGPDGKPKVCERVWISYLTGGAENLGEGFGKLTAGYGSRSDPKESRCNIGPEFTFGIYMSKAYDGPILIIKTAWGGKSLNTDFRSPSAGPYVFNEQALENLRKQGKDIGKVKADKAKWTGYHYRLMMEHVKKVLADPRRVCPAYDEKAGYEIAGFVWFQGWNDWCDHTTYPDKGPGKHAEYSRLMAHFIRDVRKDLSPPKMPFVIGVMGVWGVREKPDYFRQAMAAPAEMPEFKGNVAAVPTAPYWEELTPIEIKVGELHGVRMNLMFKDPKGPNKDGKMTKEQQEAYLMEYKAKVVKLTPGEEALWNRATSHEGYHYFGSAKIIGRIGKAFAEAMLEMGQK